MKRIAVGVLVAAMGGSLLLTGGPAAAERADLGVRITGIAPDPVQVKAGEDTEVKIGVLTRDAARVELLLKPLGDRYRTLAVKETKAANRGEFWRFTAAFNEKDPEGRWLATAIAYDKDGKSVRDFERFVVEHVKTKFDTKIWRFSADPGKVRKGRFVFFEGSLIANEDERWRGYRGQEVGIYYRRHENGAWKLVTSTETGRRGKFSAKARAFKSGEYRAVFEGNDEANGSESETDFVRVVRRWR